MKRIVTFLLLLLGIISSDISAQSVAREWNEQCLNGVRNDFARPTVVARNLWHLSAAMYDAWAAYDPIPRPYFLGESVGDYFIPFNGVSIPGTPEEIEAAREEAISYAAYRFLYHRYNDLPSTNEVAVLASLDQMMSDLGYSTAVVSTDYENDGPAALGNYIAEQVIAFGLQDGSFEEDGYANQYYESIYLTPPPPAESEALVTQFPGNPTMKDPNRWQPLTLIVAIDQGGNPLPINTPDFLSPEWGNVVPFSLTEDDKVTYERDGNSYQVYCDPGNPHFMDETTPENGIDDPYKWGNAMVAVWSGLLDHTNGINIDISPNGIGNVTDYPETSSIADYSTFYDFIEGLDSSQGYDVNPATGLAYDSQVVPMGDYGRVLAEFWADGPDSELPPGHWFSITNYVNDHPALEKKWNGQGETLGDLEWDIKLYFAMGGAMHDCAVASWGIKGWYDYVRPISAIRYMGDEGQSTDETLPSYSPSGLPLIDGFIELVDVGDPLVGVGQEHLNKIKLKSWKGPDYLDQLDLAGNVKDGILDSLIAGVDWILAENWWPYQRPSFVTPPFAGYVSGHSTFSRAAAEVLALITGDEYFPGGMGVFDAPQDNFLVFEQGPSVDIQLQWAKYKDASDQCSLSRIFGGIHPPIDDIPGRKIGEKIGQRVYDLVTYIANPAEPRVILSSVSTDMINDAYAGTDLTIEVNYNQPMDLTSTPTITFNQDLSVTLTELSGVWTSDDTFLWTFSTQDAGVMNMDIQAEIGGAMDLDGDVQELFTLSNSFIIDTENPSVSSAFFGSNINESLVGTTVNLLISFSEDVEEAVPSLVFTNDDPTVNSLSLQIGDSEWLSDAQYSIGYLVIDADEELYDMQLEVDNITDLAGNSIEVVSQQLGSYLDTRAAELVSVAGSIGMVNESTVGSEGFSIAVTYDEALEDLSAPVLSFPLESPDGNVVLNETMSGFTAPETYTFVFDVLDNDAEIDNIDVSVAGISDVAGNPSGDIAEMDLFSIDTKAPSVQNVTLSSTEVSDAETGDQFTATIDFDELMDENTPVQLTFDPSQPLSLTSSTDSQWLTGQIYQSAFDISDEEEESLLSLLLESATDVAGNEIVAYGQLDAVTLDNKNPEGFVTANTYDITNANSGVDGFQLIVLFDEEVSTDVIPEISFPVEDPSASITLNAGSSGWFGSAYRFNFDVSNDLTPLAYTDMNVSNAEDLIGNSMTMINLIDYFSIQLDTFLVVNELSFNELKVFPNPVTKGELFTVEMDQIASYKVEMYDQLGRKVEVHTAVIANDKLEVSTLGLASGKYFIKLKGEDSESVLRIEVLN